MILSVIYNQYQKKLNYPKIYYGYAFHSNILAISKILESENQDFSLNLVNFQKVYDSYKDQGRTDNIPLIENVIKSAQTYLEK